MYVVYIYMQMYIHRYVYIISTYVCIDIHICIYIYIHALCASTYLWLKSMSVLKVMKNYTPQIISHTETDITQSNTAANCMLPMLLPLRKARRSKLNLQTLRHLLDKD